MLVHVQLHFPAAAHAKLHVAYLTSWHNRIFGYKLRTIEVKNP